MLLTHIAMSHELQRGTKRTAVHELPLAQQLRVATAVETPSYQQQQQWQCMQMQPLQVSPQQQQQQQQRQQQHEEQEDNTYKNLVGDGVHDGAHGEAALALPLGVVEVRVLLLLLLDVAGELLEVDDVLLLLRAAPELDKRASSCPRVR